MHDTFRKRVEKELSDYRSITLPSDYNPEQKKSIRSRKADEPGECIEALNFLFLFPHLNNFEERLYLVFDLKRVLLRNEKR